MFSGCDLNNEETVYDTGSDLDNEEAVYDTNSDLDNEEAVYGTGGDLDNKKTVCLFCNTTLNSIELDDLERSEFKVCANHYCECMPESTPWRWIIKCYNYNCSNSICKTCYAIGTNSNYICRDCSVFNKN